MNVNVVTDCMILKGLNREYGGKDRIAFIIKEKNSYGYESSYTMMGDVCSITKYIFKKTKGFYYKIKNKNKKIVLKLWSMQNIFTGKKSGIKKIMFIFDHKKTVIEIIHMFDSIRVNNIKI